jgi:hypothetical protein
MVGGWGDRDKLWHGAGVTTSMHFWCHLLRGWCDSAKSLDVVSVYSTLNTIQQDSFGRFYVWSKFSLSYRKRLQLSKVNIQHLKTIPFFTFCGLFLPSWIRIQLIKIQCGSVKIRTHNSVFCMKFLQALLRPWDRLCSETICVFHFLISYYAGNCFLCVL